MKKTILVLILVVLSCTLVFAGDLNDINAFDRLVVKDFNKGLDTASTILQFTTLATPAVLLAEDSSEYVKIGTMYLETIGLTYGAKELLKLGVHRDRPYTYFDTYSDGNDDYKSFPSGHSALAFAGASFTSYVFCKYNPDSEWKIPVVATSYALAAATATLRVMGGSHFMTDVLSGALIGTVIGIGVPFLHTLGSNTTVNASPFSLAFSVAL